jgi:hypothetical protein
MPSGRNDDTYNRLLNAEEREARARYLAVHPEDELRLPPNLAGFGEIQSWLDAGEPSS